MVSLRVTVRVNSFLPPDMDYWMMYNDFRPDYSRFQCVTKQCRPAHEFETGYHDYNPFRFGAG